MEVLESAGGYGPLFQEVAREFVSSFERTARALCRLFTLGPLGDEAKTYTAYVSPFLFLMDGELGKRDYHKKSDV
ncbi:MAG: hypothetical protein C4521_04245 [Actinobacteria bacterium]|nr:MAG: hypothetical protein C4521_04245 [Actinomycetota bacterium]